MNPLARSIAQPRTLSPGIGTLRGYIGYDPKTIQYKAFSKQFKEQHLKEWLSTSLKLEKRIVKKGKLNVKQRLSEIKNKFSKI